MVTDEIINHLIPFSGMCLILAPYFDWFYIPTIFVSSWDIPQSVHNADYICEERVGIFPLPLFPVDFSPSFVF